MTFPAVFHRNSMSSLRKGNNENRKSVFYTTEEWELLDPTPKDLEDSMALEEKRKHLAEGGKGRSGRKRNVCLAFFSIVYHVISISRKKVEAYLSTNHVHVL